MSERKVYTIDKIWQAVKYIQGNGLPHDHPGYWDDAAEKLSESNMDPLLQGKLYPLVFLNVKFKERVNSETNEVNPNPLNIFIVNKVDERNLSVLEQHEKEFPVIRSIEEKLLRAFKFFGCKFVIHDREEYFFNKKEKNKLNREIYVIHMTFSDFIYFKNCKNG